MTDELDEVTVLSAILEARLADVHTALPAKVLTYDAAKQVCDLQILVRDFYYDTSNAIKTRSFPVLTSVPVAFVRGGGYFESMPLAKDDTGMVVFCELPIDRWRSTGQESHPINARRHGVSNGVFYPGVSARKKALTEAGIDDHMVLGKEGGETLHLKPAQICLGSENPSFTAAHAEKIATELARIQTDLTTLTAAIAAGLTAVGIGMAANGPTGATAFNNALPLAWPSAPSSVASTKVKLD